MNRQARQFMGRLLTTVLLAAVMTFESFAANARIAFSDPSAQVGQEVSVTMKFSSTDGQMLGDTKVTLDYDAEMLEYVSGTDNVSGGTGKLVIRGASGTTEVVSELRFRALKAGSAKITVSDWEGYDNNGSVLADVKKGSSTITIQGLATSSDDASLQSLQISPGNLEPAFTPGTENYTATVGLDTENLTVSAIPNNSNATVALEGDSGLQQGENTVICRVTAEDGATVKTYTIVVNKVEGGENSGEAAVPEEVPEVLADLNSQAKKVQIIPRPEDVAAPEGMTESEITINGSKVIGWVPSGQSNPAYCVFYCINENGEKGFYRYDRGEKTLQRYFDDGAKVDPELLTAGEKYNALIDDYNMLKWIAIGGGGSLLALVLLLLILLISARRSQGNRGGASSYPAAREAKATSRMTSGKRMSREERYMMGEEEDYEEEDEEDDYEEALPVEAYQPEPANQRDSLDYRPEPDFKRAEVTRTKKSAREENYPARRPSQARSGQQAPMVDMERTLAASLAREAAALEDEASYRAEEGDDFEFFDLDE
ncbi:MAG: hypothetical protein HFG54_11030 [Lachnospiraceae bacterium]|jgi:hypothetical protein|nr:hypothetical protein [Lachnospiraceae bacterium]